MITPNRQELVLLATTYAPSCRYSIDKHLEGYYTLQYMESGGVEVEYDDRSYHLEGEWFWPAYPGPRIKFHAAPNYGAWFHRHIGFRGPLVNRWIASGLWPLAPQPAPALRNYPELVDEMIQQAKRTDDWGWLRTVNLLEQLLIDLAEARESSQSLSPWAADVMAAILEQRSFAPDYDRIAARFGVGLSTLRRRFRESAGIPLHSWVLQTRMTEAQTLLTETDRPVAEIASLLGYENVYFFSRQFHEQSGATPTAYRASRLRSPAG